MFLHLTHRTQVNSMNCFNDALQQKDPIQHHLLNSVILGFQTPSIWNNFSVFPFLSYLRTKIRLFCRIFLRLPEAFSSLETNEDLWQKCNPSDALSSLFAHTMCLFQCWLMLTLIIRIKGCVPQFSPPPMKSPFPFIVATMLLERYFSIIKNLLLIKLSPIYFSICGRPNTRSPKIASQSQFLELTPIAFYAKR